MRDHFFDRVCRRRGGDGVFAWACPRTKPPREHRQAEEGARRRPGPLDDGDVEAEAPGRSGNLRAAVVQRRRLGNLDAQVLIDQVPLATVVVAPPHSFLESEYTQTNSYVLLDGGAWATPNTFLESLRFTSIHRPRITSESRLSDRDGMGWRPGPPQCRKAMTVTLLMGLSPRNTALGIFGPMPWPGCRRSAPHPGR